MGYTTDFWGSMKFNKPVDEQLKNYVNRLGYTRRMARDPEKIKEVFPNWKELCYNGELGKEGEYFAVDKDDNFGQTKDASVTDYNEPPSTQPSLWCQWIINEDGTELLWDGSEKFYGYVKWLQYLYDNFFKPNGYKLNGVINFQGEDYEDRGKLYFKDDTVQCVYAELVFEDE